MSAINKKLLTVFLMLLSLFSYSQSGELDEVVYLKNGSIIRGIIIEQIPSKGIKIKTKDENIFYFSYDEIEKITKEPKLVTKNTKSKRPTDSGKSNDEQVESNQNALTLGYGIGFSYKQTSALYKDEENYKSSTIGPLSLNFEKRLKKFSIGGNLNYVKVSSSWREVDPFSAKVIDYTINVSTIQVLGRLAYHFLPINKKFDSYIGAGFGYTHFTVIDKYSKIKMGIPIGYSLYFGARYFPSNNFGVFIEAGAGLAVLNGGLALRF